MVANLIKDGKVGRGWLGVQSLKDAAPARFQLEVDGSTRFVALPIDQA